MALHSGATLAQTAPPPAGADKPEHGHHEKSDRTRAPELALQANASRVRPVILGDTKGVGLGAQRHIWWLTYKCSSLVAGFTNLTESSLPAAVAMSRRTLTETFIDPASIRAMVD